MTTAREHAIEVVSVVSNPDSMYGSGLVSVIEEKLEQYAAEQLRAVREENERLSTAVLAANALLIACQDNKKICNLPEFRKCDQAVIEVLNDARAAINRPAAVPAEGGGGEKG